MDVKQVTVYLETGLAEDSVIPILSAPAAGVGGSLRILEIRAINHEATAGTAQFSLQPFRYSAAGTPAVNGTLSPAIGGTSHWAARTPKVCALDTTVTTLSPGEFAAVKYTLVDGGALTAASVMVSYMQGV